MSANAAAACLFACGCASWVLSDFSRPIMMVNGEMVLAQKPKGLRLIPFEDLEFKVSQQTQGFTITISSTKWTIEGCGTGAREGEIVLDSIGGIKDPRGGELVIRESGSRADYRIFVEDSRGKRHLLP